MKGLFAAALGTVIGVIGFQTAAEAVPILNPTNGHYYEFVSTGTTNISWADAETAAAGMTYMGFDGYLATLTTQPESDWFESQFHNTAGWLGGEVTSGTTEGTRIWSWVTGPDQFAFWQETGLDGAGTAIGGAYTDWLPGEPNFQQAGANFLRYVAGASNGGWDDTVPRPGYFVEYSASTVPEPTTVGLVGLGLLGLGFAQRRRKNEAA